ncbi:response regulator [uncultured Robinsoniella sp.]|uniref:response regulator transcription factor n=1 Tax=uncultured Robinsoniella sp. TaxID=904190 RepID=UPI00374F1F38
MMKVIVVEDEPAILAGIVRMIENLELDMEVRGSYRNGEQALAGMEKDLPDIVVTDIRMPVMNGLELIGEAQKRYEGIEYVVLSGYSEFAYAKEAIRFGVDSYILKPPVQSELQETLKRLTDKIEKRKQKVLCEELQNAIFNDEYAKDVLEKGFEGYSCCYLLLVCVGAFSMRAETLIRPLNEIWNSASIREKLKGKAENDWRYFVFDSKALNEKLVFLASKDDSIVPVKHLVNRLSSYEKLLEMPVNIVLSKAFSNTEELGKKYRDIRFCMSNQALIGKSHMTIMGEEVLPEAYIAIGNQEKDRLSSLLEKDDFKGVIQCFQQLCIQWKKNKITQINCEFSMKYFMSEIYRNYPGLQQDYTMEQLLYEVEAIIGGTLSYEGLLSSMVALIKKIGEKARKSMQNKTLEDVVELMYEYIRTQYAQGLAVEEFASKYGYNATYVANQFTAIKKISPNRLVTNLRLNRAKELLQSSDYRLRDIAEMIGYHDVSYFSRIFKDSVGISPRQYREDVDKQYGKVDCCKEEE